MQNFYRNYSPFFYNNIYRKNFIHSSPNVFSFSPSDPRNLNSNIFPNSHQNTEKISSSSNNEYFDNSSSKNLPPNKDFILDLFGLKLYFDDVLILSLIFFLYKEDVKDEGLFLALVLLLIS